jgi:acetyltransferase-like isoleucine patch superfamily enzyme
MLILEKLAAAPRAFGRLLGDLLDDEVERRRLAGVTYATGVIVRGARHIKTGRNVFLDHRAYLNCNSLDGKPGFIEIGDNVEIGPYSIVWGGGGVTIGNDVHIGSHVHITSMEGSQISPHVRGAFEKLVIGRAPVVIGDHVLIYSGAVIVPGVTIGHHAAIGAGAVVTEDVPPYALVGGIPARVIRYSTQEERSREGSVIGSI